MQTFVFHIKDLLIAQLNMGSAARTFLGNRNVFLFLFFCLKRKTLEVLNKCSHSFIEKK